MRGHVDAMVAVKCAQLELRLLEVDPQLLLACRQARRANLVSRSPQTTEGTFERRARGGENPG